jgi:hypothetical protein
MADRATFGFQHPQGTGPQSLAAFDAVPDVGKLTGQRYRGGSIGEHGRSLGLVTRPRSLTAGKERRPGALAAQGPQRSVWHDLYPTR